MTVSETETSSQRRSQRIREINSSQVVTYDEDIYNSDYEGEEEEEEEEEEAEYQDTASRKKRSAKQSKRSIKRTKIPTSTSGEDYAAQRDQFEENYLFQALNDPEVSIVELANDWVEEYKLNKNLAKKDLVNLILNIVGCFTTIEEHDVTNNESASETVGEIQAFFKRQKIHEFFLLSKKPEYKHLKKNISEFIIQIIEGSDETGILYENIVLDEDEEADENEDGTDDANIMEDLLVWLSSFSVSSIRSLRFLSTFLLLNIETTLCKAIKKSNTSIEKFNHQLETEKKKKNTAALKKRVSQIEQNISTYTRQSTILSNLIKDILNTTFIHRFKDVDPLIRVEAMSFLGQWMVVYPEHFFKVTYLKYFGWVLSDENHSVRLQVIKTLIKLLKHDIVVTGLRQFFERFKSRIIEIAFHDIDLNVRSSSIVLLSEVYKLGFFEDEEVYKILSLIFSINDKRSIPLLANFIQQVEQEKTNELTSSLDAAIISSQEQFPLDLKEIVKIHTLIDILYEAQGFTSTEKSIDLNFRKSAVSKIASFAKILLSLNPYTALSTLLVKYFVLDTSSFESLSQELTKFIELNESQERILLDLILGTVLSINDNDDKKTKAQNDSKESRSNEIIPYLPQMVKKAESLGSSISILIKIFTSFDLKTFESLNRTEIFKSVYASFFRYLKINNIPITLRDDFISLFHSLGGSDGSKTVDEIDNTFLSFTSELLIELKNLLKDEDFVSSPNFQQLYEDYTFKLLLLGVRYDISDLYGLFNLFREAIFAIIPNIDINKSDEIAIASIYKLFLSATSWRLNRLLKTNEVLDIEKELKIIPELLSYFYDTIHQKSLPLGFRSDVAVTLIDYLVILRNFFAKYKASGKSNLSNAERFREIDLSSFLLSEADNQSFLNIFLSLEALYANSIELELDREDDEDVNLNSLKSQDHDEDLITGEPNIWELEKNLAAFTVKLLRFHSSGFLSEGVVKRIGLNSKKLGELFEEIFETGAQKQTSKNNNVTSIGPAINANEHDDDDTPMIDLQD